MNGRRIDLLDLVQLGDRRHVTEEDGR